MSLIPATLLIAQPVVLTPSAPPLTPAEAARTLLAASPDLHVRPGLVFEVPPRVVVVPAAPRAAPKPTRLPPYPSTTPWVHVGQAFTPVIDVRIVGEPGRARTAASR